MPRGVPKGANGAAAHLLRQPLVDVGDLHRERLAVRTELGLRHRGERRTEAGEESVDARLELGWRQGLRG